MEETAPPPAPIDPGEPYALRRMIVLRYGHLNLKFSTPLISKSGKHEASWIGGNAVADTEAGLLAEVLEAMGGLRRRRALVGFAERGTRP
jgi:hypothetical protein